ncbi:EF-Hand 1, calcium-binding site,Actinin-type actin-binding domain, conserved site,EF-hand domain [Cinara cedri]|uniref:EF-Hand 1, calcium-binding site,Actinin-type actin-binding domain, conserved site,EF-hand domain n=2 Tax=Cinara cedri TaxID=506608 RepID=A0A5E4MS21_9HEMI|nr:EF-Hand 1, calcium-binding site,Actinin-type actin-binding domain, conserved site,EF-hand domain [Cinara cedri]
MSKVSNYIKALNGNVNLAADDELKEQFTKFDKNGDGSIDLSELQEALDSCGFKLPAWKVRKMIEDYDNKKTQTKGKLVFSEFQKLCSDLKAGEVASSFKQVVSKKENLETLGGMSDASSEGTTHSVRIEEQLAFSDWINSNLSLDPDLKHLLPIASEGKNLYEKVKDGILLCKVINHSCPDTIDERAINKESNKSNLTVYKKLENLTLALVSSQAIGCNIVNIDAHDLAKGKPHLVLGLLWQIIRIGLFNQITLENCPGLATLLQDGEKIEELIKLSPEAILLRWVNYHLNRAGVSRQCHNFQNDITDSEIYTYLMKQIAPIDSDVDMCALMEPDMNKRAEMMLQQAAKLGCRSFVTPADVVNGVYKLNLAFVANLFNNHPGLDKPEGEIAGLESIEETREEKTYRNWMNSMGVAPHVNWLYSDLADGLVIFQLYDIIKPGIVNWSKVHRKFSKLRMFMEKLENCNYAVELGRQLKFSLVGIAGQDLNDGNATLTLALIWQLMRAYTLSVLTQLANTGSPIIEKEIVIWVNNKLQNANKSSVLRGFQDQALSDGRIVIDLIDSIKPGTINYDVVKESDDIEDKLANAKYAISMARKTGARVYALPEDITEVKPKMVMTLFACLMAIDYVPYMAITGKADS